MFYFFYTDPGSGMMLLQILLGFLAGGMFFFRKTFSKIFGRNKSAAKEANDKVDSKPTQNE